jgi:hypothetical protein
MLFAVHIWHYREVFPLACQVMRVLDQMKLALVRARCSYPLFISGPARPRDKQWRR